MLPKVQQFPWHFVVKKILKLCFYFYQFSQFHSCREIVGAGRISLDKAESP